MKRGKSPKSDFFPFTKNSDRIWGIILSAMFLPQKTINPMGVAFPPVGCHGKM
jgi:hypothetical protein